MATKQGFYFRIHLYDDLTISVFHFHFPFPVSISTVSNSPVFSVYIYYKTEIFVSVNLFTTIYVDNKL